MNFQVTNLIAILTAVLIPALSARAHTNLTLEEANAFIDANDRVIVVDVRELHEYCSEVAPVGHIPGALNYPLASGELVARYEELPMHEPLLIVCRSGNRSNTAANLLDSKGFTDVYDMTGGMSSWLWERSLCIDSDEDGLNDDLDNCPLIYNPSQTDADADGLGNPCDQNCPNLDGLNPVNFLDYSELANNWLIEGTGRTGDLNQDLTVNFKDLKILAQYWLTDCHEQKPL
jgi:rhodanese-related sulfurtransferase